MDVQLDLSMRTAGILEGWSLTEYQSQYEGILQTLSTSVEPRVIEGQQWYKNNQYLFYEDRFVVPEARLDGCLQWCYGFEQQQRSSAQITSRSRNRADSL